MEKVFEFRMELLGPIYILVFVLRTNSQKILSSPTRSYECSPTRFPASEETPGRVGVAGSGTPVIGTGVDVPACKVQGLPILKK